MNNSMIIMPNSKNIFKNKKGDVGWRLLLNIILVILLGSLVIAAVVVMINKFT